MALAAIKLQARVRTAAYPHANIAWYVHPPALAGADYSTIDKLLEGSLIRCTYDNLRAVGGQVLKSSGAFDYTIFLNLNAR